MRTTMIQGLSIASALGLAGTAVAQPSPAASTPPPPPAVAPAPTAPAPPPTTPAPPPTTPTADTSASATAGTPAPAAWRFAVTPRFGVTVPTSKLGAFVIGGVQIDYAPAVADHRLLLGLDLSLTRPSHDSTVMDPRIPGGSGSYAIHETEMAIGLTAAYHLLATERSLVPWVGGGPVLQLLKTTETTSLAPGENTATSTELGLEVFGGADLRVGPGFLVGDLRLVYSKLDHGLTGSTNAGKLALEAGYRFVF